MSTMAKWLMRHPKIDDQINYLFLALVERTLKSDYRRA